MILDLGHALYEPLRIAAAVAVKHADISESVRKTMKSAESPSKAAGQATEPTPGPVSIRTMYADAMREVMADPRKAIAEYDPWLAALLFPCVSATHPKS